MPKRVRTQSRPAGSVGEMPGTGSHPSEPSLRPAEICRQLLAALDASEGRRRRRRRNTTPDAIGLALKRRLLEDTVRADPDPGALEGWLLERCQTGAVEGEGGDPGHVDATGSIRAMALDIMSEYRLAQVSGALRSWLKEGAPSDDAEKAPGRRFSSA